MKRYSLTLRCTALAVTFLLLLQDVLWANPALFESKPQSLQIPSMFSGHGYDYIKIPFKFIVTGGNIESLSLPLSLKVGSRTDTPFYAFNGKYIENGCWVVPCTVRDDKTGKALIDCEVMDTGDGIKLRNIKVCNTEGQADEKVEKKPEEPKANDGKGEAEKEKFLLRQIEIVKNWNVLPEKRISAIQAIKDAWVEAGRPDFNDMLGRLDLHNHTIYSDGQFTPAYLVLANWFRGVSGMAITDHNTFDALPEAMEVADILDITIVPGIELAVFDRDIPAEKFHCAVYWKGDTDSFKAWELSESGRRWKARIKDINRKAAEKMEIVRQGYNDKYLGQEISRQDVLDMFPSGAVKRTDLARVIFRKYGSLALGVDDIHRAKEKFLKNIKTDIHDTEHTFNINEIKELCAENRFRLVMVHPLVRSKWDIVQVEEVYRKHAPFFDGVEIWHSSASDGQMKSLEDMVSRLNKLIYKDKPLIVTIGSDTHGKFDKRFGFNMSSRTELGRQALDGSFRASGILPLPVRKRYIAQLLLHWGLSDKGHRTLIDITPVCKLIDDDVLNELKSLAYSDRRKKAAAFVLRALIKGRLLGDSFVDKARQMVAVFREAPTMVSSHEPSYFERALQQQKDIFIGKEPADTVPTPRYKTYYKDEPKLQDYFIEISKMNIELIKLLAERTRYKRKRIGGLLLDTTVQNIKDQADKLLALAKSIEDPTHPYIAETGNTREKVRSDLRRAAELVRGKDDSPADPAYRSNETAACAKLVGCASAISSEMEYLIRKRTERHPGYPRKRVSSRSGVLYVRHGRRINVQVSPSSSVSLRVSDEQPYELISEAISAQCKEVKSQIDELRYLKETVSRLGSFRKELLAFDTPALANLVGELDERLKRAQVPAKVIAHYAALISKELISYEEPQPGLLDMTIGMITKFLILRINELSRMIESTRDGKLQDLRDEEDELIGDSESLVASVLDAVKGNKVSDAVKTIEYVTHAKQLKGLRRFFDDSNWRFMKKYLGKAKVMLGKDDLTGARETLEKAKDRIKKGKAMTGTVRGIYEAYFESNLFGKKVSLEEVFERTFLEYFVRSGLNKASPEERIRRAALWRIELYQFVFIPYRIEQPSSGKNNKEKVFNPFHLALSHFIKVAYGNPSMSIAKALEETVNMFGSGASFRHNALLKPQQIDHLRHIVLGFDIHSILELPEQFPADRYRFDFKSKSGWVIVDKEIPTIFFTRGADGVWGNGNAPSGGVYAGPDDMTERLRGRTAPAAEEDRTLIAAEDTGERRPLTADERSLINEAVDKAVDFKRPARSFFGNSAARLMPNQEARNMLGDESFERLQERMREPNIYVIEDRAFEAVFPADKAYLARSLMMHISSRRIDRDGRVYADVFMPRGICQAVKSFDPVSLERLFWSSFMVSNILDRTAPSGRPQSSAEKIIVRDIFRRRDAALDPTGEIGRQNYALEAVAQAEELMLCAGKGLNEMSPFFSIMEYARVVCTDDGPEEVSIRYDEEPHRLYVARSLFSIDKRAEFIKKILKCAYVEAFGLKDTQEMDDWLAVCLGHIRENASIPNLVEMNLLERHRSQAAIRGITDHPGLPAVFDVGNIARAIVNSIGKYEESEYARDLYDALIEDLSELKSLKDNIQEQFRWNPRKTVARFEGIIARLRSRRNSFESTAAAHGVMSQQKILTLAAFDALEELLRSRVRYMEGSVDLSGRPGSFNKIIEETFSALKKQKRSSIVIVFKLDDRALDSVVFDPFAVRKIAAELASNEFTVEGITGVEVAARLEDGVIRLTVSDNGPGISADQMLPRWLGEDELPRIFSYGVTMKKRGTGLGLFEVADTVRRCYGGDIAVRNGPDGRGAIFDVSLPLAGRKMVSLEKRGKGWGNPYPQVDMMKAPHDQDVFVFFTVDTSPYVRGVSPKQVKARLVYERHTKLNEFRSCAMQLVNDYGNGSYRFGLGLMPYFEGRYRFEYSLDNGATWRPGQDSEWRRIERQKPLHEDGFGRTGLARITGPARIPVTGTVVAVFLATCAAALGETTDSGAFDKVTVLLDNLAYPIALMGGVVLSAVTAWLIWKCFTVELDDDVRKMLREKEETTDTVSKPPLFDPSVIVCEKHKEAIFSKIRMDEPIKSGVKRHLAKSWFERTFINHRRMLLMPYYDNKTNEIRAGALIEIFKWRGTTYVIYMGGKQTEPHRIAEEVIRLDVVSTDPGRVVFVFDENATGGKDIHEKFARIFPDMAVLFPSHVRAEATSSDHEALADKATGGLAAISRPAFIAYKKMRPSFEKRRQVYAEALRKSYVYEYGEKFWWTQTFVKQLMIGAFLGVIIKHAESIGVLGTYSFIQYIAQVAVPLIVIQVVMKKITGIVLHRWDRRQSGRTGVWDEMVRGDEAESSIRRTFFAMALINTVARLLFFALIPRSALAGTFGSSALFALGPGQYLTALLGWFLIEAVADVIIAEYWKEAAAGRLQYSEESVKKRLAGFFPTIEGMSSVLTNLTAGSALLVGAGIIGMGFTQALVPILIGSSAVLIISGYYLPNRMREYDHTLSVNSDFFLPMKEENRIWWSDDMTMEFNPNDVRIWSTARPIKDGHGGSWLPWLEELEMILRYREKPDIDLPVIRGKDRRDPVVRLSRIHGKVDKADIWRNVVERKVDGMHQVIICPSWQKRLIYHVAEPDNFLAGYLRAKFASGASSQRLQDAEQLLLKVPEREWDSFESAFKKELFNNGEELLQALRRGPSGRTARALEMLRRSLDSLEQVWLAYYMMEPDGILDRYLKDSSGGRAPPEKIRELACQISRLSDKKLKPLLDDLSRLGFKRLSDIVDAIGRADDKRHGEIINALVRFVEATFPDRSKQAASPAVPEIPISTAIKAADDNPAPSPKTDTADFSQFWLRANDMLDEKTAARDLLASAISSCLNKKVVLAFDINICAGRSARMLAVIEVLKELKKDERYKTLLKNLEIIKSVPENLPSRLAGYIDEGAEVFTFARASERNALQAIESKVHACYIDTPSGLSEDAYIPLPEIVTMVLGQHLKAWRMEDFKPILDKINVRSIDLGETGGAIIFTVLPCSERFNTDEDIVKHCALIKQFLVSV